MSTPVPPVRLSAGEVVARQFGAINRHDPDALTSCYSSDATVLDPMYPEPLRGRTAIVGDFVDFVTAIPDLKVAVSRTISGTDGHAVEFIMSGTHQGPLKGPSGDIPPSQRRLELPGAGFARTDADGLITHERRYYDVASMMEQLGLGL